MTNNLSPIVCFAYSRPNHLQRMLTSLENNYLASESEITFYINGVDKNTNLEDWNLVIEVAKKNWKFKSIDLQIREENIGPKKNILHGISEMFGVHDKLIIIEDDLILGPYFLKFLNESLNIYKNDKNIWHINGWSYPQLIPNRSRSVVSRYVSPWGWATWDDRWKVMNDEKNFTLNLVSNLPKKERKIFNMGGKVNWEEMIERDQKGIDNTWDCYWYQAVFLNKSKSIFPLKTHVVNGGFDGTGEHCGNREEDYPFDKTYNTKQTTKFSRNTSKLNLYFLINFKIYYIKVSIYNYFKFHKNKFNSIENFLLFMKKKLYDK